jgi:hypothetical protein
VPICIKNSSELTGVTHFAGNIPPMPTSRSVANLTWSNIWSPKINSKVDETSNSTPFELSLEPHTIIPVGNLPIRCDYPGEIENGAYLYDNDENAIGTFLIYTCQPGFTLFGDRVLQCLNSGNWSNNPPTCHHSMLQLINVTYFTTNNVSRQTVHIINALNSTYGFSILDQ